MSKTNDTVAAAADLIRERIKELDSERAQLEKALGNLSAEAPGKPAGRGSGSGRRRGGSGVSTPKVSQRRRKGGTRAEQAVKLIANNPGISAGEVASQLKLKPNYMYRVLSDLQAGGHVTKKGRAYYVAG